MKRTIMLPALVILTLLFFSCTRNEEPQTAAAPDEIDDPAEVSDEWTYGYVLRVNPSLMTIENDTGSETDGARFLLTMALGERVLVGEDRKATYSGRVTDFITIRREDGREGLAFASQIAAGGELAVVIDDRGNMYQSPRPVDVTNVILPRKTIVVCFPETEKDGFVEVRAYHPVDLTIRQNYIRTSSLSSRVSDIQSSILLQTAEDLGDSEKVRRDVLLESALLDYPDSVFNAEIQIIANPTAAAIIQTEHVAYPYAFVINDDNVNVRDLPDTVGGKIVGQLNNGDAVEVFAQTTSVYTIGGESARWYRISEPFEGWIFGAYLRPRQ